MKILIASSEVVPFAKTGGLADVCGALPIELARLGHDVSVIMPAYLGIGDKGIAVEPTGVPLRIAIGSKTVDGELLTAQLPSSEVPIYFVRQDDYFGRAGVYGENGEDYEDNCERFVFFCRAVMEAIRLLPIEVDVIHANDWTSALIPAYLKIEGAGVPPFEQIASLLTVHNIAYQGTFWHWDMLLTGLDWKYFNWHQMEFHGNLNFLKTGLAFADAVNTVSPRYAEEIQTAPLGCGLEGVLSFRRDVLSGIINGVDYDKWNPATDEYLPTNYGVDDVVEGKAACKAALQSELGLEAQPNKPLIGIVGRLAGQKGLDLVMQLIQQSAPEDSVQWAILGTGDPALEQQLRSQAIQYPQSISVTVDFSESLAHRIEAGCDMFLMPSRYEPCGLNQLYSLKYGCVPIVRETGGLADTVTDATEYALAAGTATGFIFDEYSTQALGRVLQRAIDCFLHQKEQWHQLVTTGMNQDWSWAGSASEYADLYRQTIARRRSEVAAL